MCDAKNNMAITSVGYDIFLDSPWVKLPRMGLPSWPKDHLFAKTLQFIK